VKRHLGWFVLGFAAIIAPITIALAQSPVTGHTFGQNPKAYGIMAGVQQIGVGTSKPLNLLDVEATGSAPVISATGFGTNHGGITLAQGARGTAGAPTAVQSGDSLGGHNFRGYGATGFESSSSARINGLATQNWTDAAQGAAIAFSVTANGSAGSASAEAVRIDQNGRVGIGSTAPATALDGVGVVTASGGFSGAVSGGTGTFTNLVTTGTNQLGTTGVAFHNMGVCTIASATISTSVSDQTCKGVPASAAVHVTCNGAAAFSTSTANGFYCRATGTANQVECNTNAANTTAMTYSCLWVQP
jgi:hypothetical protein